MYCLEAHLQQAVKNSFLLFFFFCSVNIMSGAAVGCSICHSDECDCMKHLEDLAKILSGESPDEQCKKISRQSASSYPFLPVLGSMVSNGGGFTFDSINSGGGLRGISGGISFTGQPPVKPGLRQAPFLLLQHLKVLPNQHAFPGAMIAGASANVSEDIRNVRKRSEMTARLKHIVESLIEAINTHEVNTEQLDTPTAALIRSFSLAFSTGELTLLIYLPAPEASQTGLHGFIIIDIVVVESELTGSVLIYSHIAPHEMCMDSFDTYQQLNSMIEKLIANRRCSIGSIVKK